MNKVELAETPPHVEYSLTDNGLQLAPALETIFDWGKDRMTKENETL